jgi:hypothetical protein
MIIYTGQKKQKGRFYGKMNLSNYYIITWKAAIVTHEIKSMATSVTQTGRLPLSDFINLDQCCATFLHSRHTKYCRRVMAAHNPILYILGGGGGGEGGLWNCLAANTC